MSSVRKPNSSKPVISGNNSTPKSSPIPATCQEDIFKNGHTVFLIKAGWKKAEIENWVQEVAQRSGEKVDWHFVAGDANVLGLGDLEKIRQTIKEMLPDLNKKIREYHKSVYGESTFFKPTKYTENDIDCWRNKNSFTSKSWDKKPFNQCIAITQR